jgi:hypothetical protein
VSKRILPAAVFSFRWKSGEGFWKARPFSNQPISPTNQFLQREIFPRFRILEVRHNMFGCEVLTAVTRTSTVFWVVKLCSSDKARRFGRTYCLHLKGRRMGQARNSKEQATNKASTQLAAWNKCILFVDFIMSFLLFLQFYFHWARGSFVTTLLLLYRF